MTHRVKDKPVTWSKGDSGTTGSHFLILYNDEVHSFNYVIESLVEVCGHSFIQAEQCTIIAHYKGKCEVKKGTKEDIEPLQAAMGKKGLTTSIE